MAIQKNDPQKNQPPARRKNKDVRPQEYLEETDIEKMIHTAKKYSPVYGNRDVLIIHMLFKHGLRVSELTGLKWEQFDFERRFFYISRAKNGVNIPHMLEDMKEIRLLKAHRKAQIAAGHETLLCLSLASRGHNEQQSSPPTYTDYRS